MKRLIILSLLLLSVTGCYLKSVNPLVTSETAITLDDLETTWQSDDLRWTFINDPVSLPEIAVRGSSFDGTFSLESTGGTIFSDENIYLVILEDIQAMSVDTTLFIGYVGDFEGDYFLDLSLLDFGADNDTFRSTHLFPVHSFSRVSINNSELSIEFFSDVWIKEQIMDNRVRIKHEQVKGGPADDDISILITAGTPELQQFVLKYKSDENAFEDAIELIKIVDEI